MARYKQTRQSSRGRVDQEHAAIRDGLVAAGYFVVDTSGVGGDFPDLLVVSKNGITILLEVKTEGEYPTEGQVSFLTNFPGPCSLAFGLEHALEIVSRHD
jgi:hypothetical protein